MTTAKVTRPRMSPGLRVGLGVAAIVAAIVGLVGSAFAMWAVWLAGGAMVVGGIATSRRARGGFVLLAVGAGLLLGAAVYIGLGLIPRGDPASGGGSGVALSEPSHMLGASPCGPVLS